MAKTQTPKEYGNDSIKKLKGADRVRKRPAVIFGSDGLEGCEHSVFEIISNSIDEAREGHGKKIVVTRFLDNSVEVQDFGRGIPVDYNNREKCYNWELVFCDLYAGGKYDTNDGGSYEYSLGLNGLGLCATQYASEYMEAEIHTGGFCYELKFKAGKINGEMKKTPYDKKDTGSRIKWRPDMKVFTDINIPLEFYQDTLKRQSVVNSGIKFILKNQLTETKFETFEYMYENGIVDYVILGLVVLLDLLDQILTAFLSQLGEYQTDDTAVILRIDTQLTDLDSFLNVLQQLGIPGGDHQGTGIGRGDGSNTVQRGLAAIVLNSNAVQNSGIGTAGADSTKLFVQMIQSLIHSSFKILKIHGHSMCPP